MNNETPPPIPPGSDVYLRMLAEVHGRPVVQCDRAAALTAAVLFSVNTEMSADEVLDVADAFLVWLRR